MPLTLDLAQTVVIGRFNPYIVTPTWLVKQGVCPDPDAEEQAEGNEPDFHAGTAVRAFDFYGYEWEVSFDRLAVTATGEKRDCGGMADAVLGKLSHTPVEAVGNNFTFVCDPATWGTRPTPGLVGAPTPSLMESRWVGLYQEAEEERIEVELTVVPDRVVVVRLNFDCRVTSTAEAREAATQFHSDYASALERMRDLFRIEIP